MVLPSSGPSLNRRWHFFVCVIVAVAAALRVSSITAGAPFRMGVDEPVILETALRIIRTGDFNPHFFDYGGLTLYLHAGAECLQFLMGAMSRRWAALDQVWIGDFLVSSRMLSVLLGTWTVFLVYRAGLRWGRNVALIAVVCIAVLPQNVREAHYALTDTPLTFFVALAMLLSLRASEQGRVTPFFYAGLAVGAAGAIKYNGVVAVIMPLAATVGLASAHTSAMAVAVTLAGTAIGFLAGAPYSVLDLPNFLNGFASLMQHYNRPRPLLEALDLYLKYMRGWFSWPIAIPVQFGWAGLAVCLVGLLGTIGHVRSRVTRTQALTLALFPLAYLWFICKQGSLIYGRYALPLTPMLAIFFAMGLVAIRERLLRQPTRARRVVAAASFLLLLPPLASSAHRNIIEQRESTLEMAGAWILDNVRPGESIVIESGKLQLPSRVRHEHVARLIERPLDAYRQAGVTYLLASSSEPERFASDPARRQSDVAQYLTLLAAARPVKVFTSSGSDGGPTLTVLKLTP